jgi:putative ABC transport system substrate-binding protein
MNKVIGIALSALLFALSFPAEAQQSKKVYRVGYLSPRLGIEAREEAFLQSMRDLGYIEGQNLTIEWRFATGKNALFPELAAELVRLRADCVVAFGVAAIRAIKQLTDTIPIVMATIDADPLN